MAFESTHSRAALLESFTSTIGPETAETVVGQYSELGYEGLLSRARADFRDINPGTEPALAPSEHLAIWSYTALNFGFLNSALRARSANGDLATLAAGLTCALSRLPDYVGISSRGVNLAGVPVGYLEAHRPGAVVEYRAFTSASHCVAQKSGKQLLIHSRHGKKIADYSAFGDGECEALFAPATCFRVDRVFGEQEHPLGVRIEMTESDCTPDATRF